jgi:hypothetical protein
MDNNDVLITSVNPEIPHPHPSPEATTSPAEPPAAQPARRSLRLTHLKVTQIVRDKVIDYHGDMIKPGATTTYLDKNEKGEDEEVSRPLKPRETMRHMKEIQFFIKLNLNQQKLDAKIADKKDQEVTSLNQFVNESVRTAGDRLHQEALAQGLSCVSELPNARIHQVYEEEKQKYDAEHPQKLDRCRKQPFEIPPEQRNDWFIPAETQIALMNRLVDMALPDGAEYKKLKPRERLMASRLLGRFCLLGQEQQLIDMRVHDQKPDLDLEKLCKELEDHDAAELEAIRQDDEEFNKTHPRGGRGRPWPRNTEVRL